MDENLRRHYLEIIGKIYQDYGFPAITGWIEGLMALECKKGQQWSQKDISMGLEKIFPSTKYPDIPTSVPSVNRALKIMESYGVLIKTGSRKLGYYYQLNQGSDYITAMFESFININHKAMAKLKDLLELNNLNQDKKLYDVIKTQMIGFKVFNEMIKELLENSRKEVEKT
ncbi:MAG: hypothetical protein ACXAC7_10725 [Candidatus Hodarchaeales archaeon]